MKPKQKTRRAQKTQTVQKTQVARRGKAAQPARSTARRSRTRQTTNFRQLRIQRAREEQENSHSRQGLPMWGRMLLAVAVVLLLTLVLFRVGSFEVSGNIRYTAEEVAEASGVTEGDVLMGVNKTKTASRILVKLPYVEQVTVEKLLPGTVRFTIVECQAMTAARSEFGTIWLLNSEGKLLEELDEDAEIAYPVITGVELELPMAGSPGAFTDDQGGTLAMAAAQAIAEAGMQSRVQSIDVSDPAQLILVYEDRLEVQLGDGSELAYRLQYLEGAAAGLSSNARGVLDLSFASGQQAVFHPLA